MTDFSTYEKEQSPAKLVKVKVRPGRKLQFPGLCVHCNQPAEARLPLRKRIGRVTRFIDLPLCQACAREVRRLSAEEERWQKLGLLAVVVTAILVFALTLFLLPGTLQFALRLVISLGGAGLGATLVWTLFRRRQRAAALPEKKAILRSARLVDFSWRATTFAFTNQQFVDYFTDLNQTLIMEES